jgi:hypothetical protein
MDQKGGSSEAVRHSARFINSTSKRKKTTRPTSRDKNQDSTYQKKETYHPPTHQHAPKHPPSSDTSTITSGGMGRSPNLRNHKPHAERLPTLLPQSISTARLLHPVRLRRTGVHFYPLDQAVPVAHWRGRVGSFAESCCYVLGADGGGALVAVRLECTGTVSVQVEICRCSNKCGWKLHHPVWSQK